MREFAAVIFSFLLIPVLSRKKIHIGVAICICSILMAVLGGLGLSDFRDVIVRTIFDIKKVQRFIIILEIGVLGVLLKKYMVFDQVIGYLNKIVRSRRITLMFIPALIGLLVVPGGAIMSAPLVDQIGEESNLSKPHRAIINLIYRHIPMNIMPYTTGFLLVGSLAPQIPIYKLIGLNLLFVIPYCITGYLLYVRKVKEDRIPIEKEDRIPIEKLVLSNFTNLLKYTLPIYLAVLLNLIWGVPFHIGMLANLLALFLIHPTKTFLIDAARAINVKLLFALMGVYLIQGVIDKMGSLTSFLTMIFSNPNTVILGIIVASFFFGMTTGFQPTAIGVVLPILVTLPISSNRLTLYCHYTFVWGFVGYFFSPLHLCQLFTCEYLKVSTIDLYKEYWKFFLCLTGILMINLLIG